MIPKETITQIIDQSDIVEVIGDYVKLKKSGNDYKGLSPFTQERTPSFFVAPAKRIFKDFSSGKGGTVISFLMEHLKISFLEAVRYLAKKYNIVIPEQADEDAEQEATRDKFYQVNNLAKDFFVSELQRPENVKIREYIRSRFTDDDVITWQIGIAPDGWTALTDHLVTQGWDKNSLIDHNLAKKTKEKVFDYFRNRIIFPIENATGNICGFGARVPGDKKDQAKYLNSPDSPVYSKSCILYGLSRARKEIIQRDLCNVVEGYSDLISMHSAGVINTVATCGTALTEQHIQQLKKHCKTINLIYDGDKAGFNATLRASELILQAGLFCLVTRPPDEEDPDTWIKSIQANKMNPEETVKSEQQSFMAWRAGLLLKDTDEDPMSRHHALVEIVRLISLIEDKSIRELIQEDLVTRYKIQKKVLKQMIQDREGNDNEAYDDDLPAEVDAREYQRWGFYSYKNEYYFRTKEGIQKMTNFIMKPLFHIKSTHDSTRIYELVNYKGFSEVIQFDMQEITSLQAFRKKIEGQGNFLYWGQDMHLSKLKQKLYEETRSALEIKNLGWQKEGFWAWSNGITLPDGVFSPIDDYGIVEFENNCYFIPAYSKIYISDRTIFENERKFKFHSRDDISLSFWSSQFCLVFGGNAKIAIAFWIAAIFRDHILNIFGNFPLLNLFGPKGTGKSQMAASLSCLFGQEMKPFNIHNGTKPGLAEHLQLFINCFALVDEYKNSLDFDKIETLKAIYDSIGRTRMNMDKGNKKETTKVNSAGILIGQEMPTADVALFSRVIHLRFSKTVFSDDEKANYQKLKDMQNTGLSHLSSMIIKFREYFTKNFYSLYDLTLSDLSNEFNTEEIEDRIMRNYASCLASFRTIEKVLSFPFSYADLLSISIDSIRIQNAQIGSSNEVSIFWDILEAMFDDNVLIDEWHFKIQYTDSIRGVMKTVDFGKGGAKNVLKFKYNTVIKLYSEHANRMKVKPLPSDTLKYYLENHEAFILVEKACRFTLSEFSPAEGKVIEKRQITSAYCFDYSKLKINLSREAIGAREENQLPVGFKLPESHERLSFDVAASKDDDNLPF